MDTIHASDTLVVIQCGECGISFAVPERWQRDRREKHDTFWCPNGHARAYLGLSETERLRKQLDIRDDLLASAREQRDAKDRSLRATRGHLTRLKNRAAAGKCPCCSKRFDDLADHMASDHPGYGGTDA